MRARVNRLARRFAKSKGSGRTYPTTVSLAPSHFPWKDL